MPSRSTSSSHAGSKSACIGGRAEERRAEAHALLVGERGDLDGRGGLCSARRESLDHGDSGEDPERPVERPGVRDGVEVRAEDDRAVAGAVPPDHVADRIAPRRHPRLRHPPDEELSRLPVGGRREAARQAVGLLAQLPELGAAGQDLGGGARHDGGR